LIYCVFGENALIRSPGDEIWHQCTNISQQILSYNINLNNVCVKLAEAPNCEVDVTFGISGRSIFTQTLDVQIASRVCGNVEITQSGFTIPCNICVSLNNDPNNQNQQCVNVQPYCKPPGLPSYIPLQKYEAGCFENEKLDAVMRCRNSECPTPNGLVCSGHGVCNSGKCQCNVGYFGSDCGFQTQLFERCQRVDQLAGDICVRLIFDNCNLKVQMVLVAGFLELPLDERTYPVKSLNTLFQQDICVNQAGCSVCLKWSNLNITPTLAHGCATLSFACGSPLASYPLGCFDDNNVVPACFGTCPNNCNGHGTCTLGLCYCTDHYSGDDCSLLSCPNNCNEQGNCQNGVCSCFSEWTGDDCTTPFSNGKSSPVKPNFTAAYVVAPLILIVGIAAVGVGVWYIKKKKEIVPRFNEFDLLEQEPNESNE